MTPTTMSGAEVAAYLRSIQNELLEEQQRLRQAEQNQPTRLAGVQNEAESAWKNMLDVLVPALDARALDWTAARLGLPSVAARAVQERWRARQQELQNTQARLAGNPEFARREALLNEAEIRIPELKETMAPLRADVEALDSEPLWAELVQDDYGTSAYRRKWYQRGFFRNWKYGSRILKKYKELFRVRDFAQLRQKYDHEKEALESFKREYDELRARTDRIETLCRQISEAQAGLAKLDEWVLGQTRALVREHLTPLSLADVTPLVQDNPALLLAAKRMHGAQAKQNYLGAVDQEWLSKPMQDVQRRLDKLSRAITKYSSPKNAHATFYAEEIEAKYAYPKDKWRQRWDRYNTTSQEIIAYDGYDCVDAATDFLWWDMMVRSHRGSFISEVDDYHQHHRRHAVYAEDSRNDVVYSNDAS